MICHKLISSTKSVSGIKVRDRDGRVIFISAWLHFHFSPFFPHLVCLTFQVISREKQGSTKKSSLAHLVTLISSLIELAAISCLKQWNRVGRSFFCWFLFYILGYLFTVIFLFEWQIKYHQNSKLNPTWKIIFLPLFYNLNNLFKKKLYIIINTNYKYANLKLIRTNAIVFIKKNSNAVIKRMSIIAMLWRNLRQKAEEATVKDAHKQMSALSD